MPFTHSTVTSLIKIIIISHWVAVVYRALPNITTNILNLPASFSFSSTRHLGTRIDTLAGPTTVFVHLVTMCTVIDAFSKRAFVVYW